MRSPDLMPTVVVVAANNREKKPLSVINRVAQMNDNGNPQETADDEDSHRNDRWAMVMWPEIAPQQRDFSEGEFVNSELSAIVKSRTECNCRASVL